MNPQLLLQQQLLMGLQQSHQQWPPSSDYLDAIESRKSIMTGGATSSYKTPPSPQQQQQQQAVQAQNNAAMAAFKKRMLSANVDVAQPQRPQPMMNPKYLPNAVAAAQQFGAGVNFGVGSNFAAAYAHMLGAGHNTAAIAAQIQKAAYHNEYESLTDNEEN